MIGCKRVHNRFSQSLLYPCHCRRNKILLGEGAVHCIASHSAHCYKKINYSYWGGGGLPCFIHGYTRKASKGFAKKTTKASNSRSNYQFLQKFRKKLLGWSGPLISFRKWLLGGQDIDFATAPLTLDSSIC